MRTTVAVTVACLAVVGLSAAQGVEAAARKDISIPAGGLGPALSALSTERRVHVVYISEDVGLLRTRGVSGSLTTDEALRQLLEGTGLTYQYIDSETVSIVPAATTRSQSGAVSKQLRSGNPAATTSMQTEQDELLRGRYAALNERLGTIAWATAKTGSAEAVGQSGVDTGRRAELEEIVVTAQKRKERLIDAPQSVSVLSGQELARIGATQFRDYANAIPGLNFSTAGAGNTQITLRGITVGFDVSPTVGIYLDEVPYGSSTVFNLAAQFALDAALVDLDRIEVLRGPQGTLYGASTMGGLIKYVTRMPDTAAFSGSARADVSSTRDGSTNYSIAGDINFPLSEDHVGLRASAFQTHDGGYVDNLARDSSDTNESDMYGGRLDLLITPTDALSVRLGAFMQNISRDGEATADYTFANEKPYGRLGQFRVFAEPFDHRFRLASATIVYDLDWGSLTSISSYQTSDLHSNWDISGVYAPLFGVAGVGLPNDSKTDKFVQEIRIASTPGTQPFEWVLGGYYNDESSSIKEHFDLLDANGNLIPNNIFDYNAPSSFEEYAVFGDLTWRLSEKFDVTGGTRFARNTQRFAQLGTFVLPAQTSSEEVFTYLANIRYHFSEDSTAYARFATGYRPGGPNIVTAAGGAPTFDSDRLKSYELGFKGESEEGQFGFEMAGYYLDWTDIQIGVIRGGFQTYTNASGGAVVRGAELAIYGRNIGGLTTTGTVAYQDAYMSEADPDLLNRKGERLPNVPRLTAALSADYVFSNTTLQPTFGTTLRYVGDRESSFDASLTYPQYRLPAYLTVDLRAGVTIGKVDVQLYGHNLLDEHGQQSIIFPQFGARVAVIQPRTIGLSVTARF